MSTQNGTDKQINFLSWNPSGWGLFDGSDHQQNLPGQPDPLALLPDNPGQYDAILKIADNVDGSTAIPGSLSSLLVAQGFQDSLNVANKTHGLRIGGHLGVNGAGQRVITFKGGTHDNSFEPDTTLHSRGSQCTVKIGDWIDQTYDADHDIDLSNLRHIDGKPIDVGCNFRAWNINYGPNCKRLFWYSLGMTAYWWFKWSVRKIMGIPVGTPGPSFLS